MGYHGTPTCEINFENAVGYLVGREHKGMANMFTFMNSARISSAAMGVHAAEKSFQNALKYAKTRRAFRYFHFIIYLYLYLKINKPNLIISIFSAAKGPVDPTYPADPIIVHPDIRKMLLTQKAIAEGGRAMLYSCALINDQVINY